MEELMLMELTSESAFLSLGQRREIEKWRRSEKYKGCGRSLGRALLQVEQDYNPRSGGSTGESELQIPAQL